MLIVQLVLVILFGLKLLDYLCSKFIELLYLEFYDFKEVSANIEFIVKLC